MTTQELLLKAKAAAAGLRSVSTEKKNAALSAMAYSLTEHAEDILKANLLDMEAAKGRISDIMMDRLALTKERIEGMADGIRKVAELPDPVGKLLGFSTRPNGIEISKVFVPMGVIAIIYESRPNVTSDAAALAIKAGSACVLRCGKEAHESAAAIVDAMKCGLVSAGISANAVELVEDITHKSAEELMTARGLVDLLIPRGGKNLIRRCVDNATVPVLETGTGICHIYVDKDADTEMALAVIENAKCSRPSVCNAAEVCLVHEDIAEEFLPKLKARLTEERAASGKHPVELRLDEKAMSVISGIPASDTDFDTEFLDYIMAVHVVSSAADAAEHIAKHSTGHSEAIITENKEAAAYFTGAVDSAAVYVNASTRFTDGGEFGLGCEMGISTQKLHARGPLGLEELCSFKYIIKGSGQIR